MQLKVVGVEVDLLDCGGGADPGVDVAGLDGLHGGVLVGHETVHDRIDLGCAQEIAGVRCELNVGTRLVIGKREGAGAHGLGVKLARAEVGHAVVDVLCHDEDGREHLHGVGFDKGEGEVNGEVVNGGGFDYTLFAVVEVDVGRGRRFVGDGVEGEDDVFGGEGLAVRPGNAFAQVGRHGEGVVGDVVGLGEEVVHAVLVVHPQGRVEGLHDHGAPTVGRGDDVDHVARVAADGKGEHLARCICLGLGQRNVQTGESQCQRCGSAAHERPSCDVHVPLLSFWARESQPRNRCGG